MNGRIVKLPVVDSTNTYARALIGQIDPGNWLFVTTPEQFAGRGQKLRSWSSEPGKNLLCSFLYKPTDLAVSAQYGLSMAACMAVIELLGKYGIQALVKWPNDILVDEKKIAGFLIENGVKGNKVEYTVIGLGLNVNQKRFSPFYWPATSMVKQTDEWGNPDALALEYLELLVQWLEKGLEDINALHRVFEPYLYRLNQPTQLIYNDEIVVGIIRGVSREGQLIIEIGGEKRCFATGEIRIRSVR
ncbi:MAG: biotin--[acetyl-CoA-carboxylase] ligase [Salibacteraceae bacterium]